MGFGGTGTRETQQGSSAGTGESVPEEKGPAQPCLLHPGESSGHLHGGSSERRHRILGYTHEAKRDHCPASLWCLSTVLPTEGTRV